VISFDFHLLGGFNLKKNLRKSSPIHFQGENKQIEITT